MLKGFNVFVVFLFCIAQTTLAQNVIPPLPNELPTPTFPPLPSNLQTSTIAKSSESFESLLAEAKQGDVISEYKVGKVLYETGKQDEGKGWFEKAADKNNSDAEYYLGLIYDDKYSLKRYQRNPDDDGTNEAKKSFEWFQKSAVNGNLKAINKVREMYSSGVGVQRDKQMAFQWLQKGAGLGDVGSQYDLGRIYESGRIDLGVEKNLQLAIYWFRKAADQESGPLSKGARSILTSYLATPTPMVSEKKNPILEKWESVANQKVSTSGLPQVLLKEGGYSSASKIQIYKTTLTLEDTSTGDVSVNASFYIFATRGPKPCVEKIKVVLENERRDIAGINLLAYAPIFHYLEVDKEKRSIKNFLSFCSLETYITVNNLASFKDDEYFVGYGKKVAHMFHYGQDYALNESVGTLTYCDLFDIILHRKVVPGEIDFAMGFVKNDEETNFRLTHFSKIYPKN